MTKHLSDSETEAIFGAIAQGVKTYEQVVEVSWGICRVFLHADMKLLTHLPQHLGGLAPLGHGLLHRWPGVSEHAVDIFLNLQEWPVCRHDHSPSGQVKLTLQVGRQAVASMNYFHRKTFLHLLEKRAVAEAYQAQAQAGEHMVNVQEQYSPDLGSGAYDHTPERVNGRGGYP
jgi:hypothetical protein